MLSLMGDPGDRADEPREDVPDAPTKTRDACRALDKFYTKPDVAERCLAFARSLIEGDVGTWLEPSAGAGAFLSLLPADSRIGLDLDPPQEGLDLGVLRGNFLEWDERPTFQGPVVTIGNPPFGRNCSLAIAFINEAVEFSDYVCMILPRTFEKEATQKKVDTRLHLVDTLPLDAKSFTHKGSDYPVPCCFQVWQRKDTIRPRSTPELRHSDFDFSTDHTTADFAFQRVGGGAGTVSKAGLKRSWKSNHFIRAKDRSDEGIRRVFEILQRIDWTAIRSRTAGNPSIGKAEIVAEYSVFSPNLVQQPSLL